MVWCRDEYEYKLTLNSSDILFTLDDGTDSDKIRQNKIRFNDVISELQDYNIIAYNVGFASLTKPDEYLELDFKSAYNSIIHYTRPEQAYAVDIFLKSIMVPEIILKDLKHTLQSGEIPRNITVYEL